MKQILHLGAFLLFSQILFSQSSLKIVVQEDGTPIIGATVELSNPQDDSRLASITNASGIVSFPVVKSQSEYELLVKYLGYHDYNLSGLNFREGEQKKIVVPLAQSAVVLDELTIVASDQQINRRNSEVAFVLPEKQLQELPVEGRDITRALFRLPNVTQATGFYPEAPNVAINGANSLYTNYMIDGLDNNERFLGGQKFAAPIGFVRNIALLANNYSAEYGSANGVVNLTSQSGSNTLKGEVFFVTRPGQGFLDSSSPYAQRDLSGNFVDDSFKRFQGGFSVGGPIVKDKTFFYVNIEATEDFKKNLLSSPDLGIAETVDGNNYFRYYSGKIDHIWNEHFNSSVRLNIGDVGIERQGGGLEGGVTFPSAGTFQIRNSLIAALKNSYVNKDFSVQLNIQRSRFHWDYAQPLNASDSPQVRLRNPQEQLVAIIGSPDYTFDSFEDTWQIQNKYNLIRNNHEIKFGFDIITSNQRLFGGGNPNGNFVAQLTQEQIDQLRESQVGAELSIADLPSDIDILQGTFELRPNDFGRRQTQYALYLEDELSVTQNTTLTFGLRYMVDNLSKGASDSYDLNNIGPRFNVNHNLANNQSIRFGYGLYYDKINYAIVSDALQQNNTSEGHQNQILALQEMGVIPADARLEDMVFDGNYAVTLEDVSSFDDRPDVDPNSSREFFTNERRVISPFGYDNPQTHQFMVGYQKELKGNSLFYVDLVYNRSSHLPRIYQLNPAAPYPVTDPENVIVRTAAEADASRTLPVMGDQVLVDGVPMSGMARNIIITQMEGKSEYKALSLNYQKTNDGGDVFRFNYTLSRLENDTEGINFRALDGNNFSEDRGPSINDRTHVFSIIYSKRWKQLNFTFANLLQSGQPVNFIPDALIYGTTDLNGDGRSYGDAYVGNSDRYPGETRNSGRLPWGNVLDLNIGYSIPISNNKLVFSMDVFNVLNNQNWSGYSNNATQSNQIQIGPSDGGFVRKNSNAPRQFQFGLSYHF